MMDDADELAHLAGKYLELWLEHWASWLSAPDTAQAMARLMTTVAPAAGGGFGGTDDQTGRRARNESQALRAAPNVGDVAVGKFEDRIAALEQRVAELEHVASVAEHSGRPRPGPKKI